LISPKSTEHYLEAIFLLSRSGVSVRSVDVAKELQYSKASVSVAIKNLRTCGHIMVSNDGHITLTESGVAIAQKIYDRHMLMADWLVYLGVDRETAVNDACKIEHDISDESFVAMQKHIEEWKHTLINRRAG